MKYSISGAIPSVEEHLIVDIINNFNLWRLNTSTQRLEEIDVFHFEAWVNEEIDKSNLFNSMKKIVDNYGGDITWHECTHDEEIQSPCVISEVYRGE